MPDVHLRQLKYSSDLLGELRQRFSCILPELSFNVFATIFNLPIAAGQSLAVPALPSELEIG